MLFSRFFYFSKEAWQSIKRGGLMSVVATSTIAISLLILGVFLLIFLNLHNLMNTLHSKLDIVVYLKAGLTDQQISRINVELSQLTGVRRIVFVSKEQAWEQFRSAHAGLSLDEYIGDNPLPDSFKVEAQDISYLRIIANRITEMDSVDDVRYGGDMAEKVARFVKIISSAGSIIVLLLGVSTLMIVVNTIRLTVIARENEINIMSLVGATKDFVKGPFILEGIYLGLIGSFIALAGLKLGYDVTVINIQRHIPFLPISLNVKEVNLIFLIVVISGMMLGWIGGYVSVSKTQTIDEQ